MNRMMHKIKRALLYGARFHPEKQPFLWAIRLIYDKIIKSTE